MLLVFVKYTHANWITGSNIAFPYFFNYLQAKALEKELATVSFFGCGVNSCGKNENIQKAAECHLLVGNLKKYCELKVQLGEVIF